MSRLADWSFDADPVGLYFNARRAFRAEEAMQDRPIRQARRGVFSSILFFCVVGQAIPAPAAPRIGQRAPRFELWTLSGERFSHERLRGQPAVLVVGRTQKAAPPCKKWAVGIIKRRQSLAVYQVIVVDKPWYIPRSFVLDRVRAFTPRHLHGRVLLEWRTAFAEAFGIDKHDDPVVVVLGPDSVIRWRYRGHLAPSASRRLDGVLEQLARMSSPPPGASVPPRRRPARGASERRSSADPGAR